MWDDKLHINLLQGTRMNQHSGRVCVNISCVNLPEKLVYLHHVFGNKLYKPWLDFKSAQMSHARRVQQNGRLVWLVIISSHSKIYCTQSSSLSPNHEPKCFPWDIWDSPATIRLVPGTSGIHQLSHEKNPRILSIESWLLIGILIMVYYHLHITV